MKLKTVEWLLTRVVLVALLVVLFIGSPILVITSGDQAALWTFLVFSLSLGLVAIGLGVYVIWKLRRRKP
jgi:hypothetical protein